MRSLFFWRRKEPAAAPVASQPAAAPPEPVTAPATPMAPAAEGPARLPLQQMVIALALGDERAADTGARPDPAHTQLLLAASRNA